MTRKLVNMTIILGGSKMSDFTENTGNRKEEILERSRNTFMDEGIDNAELRGYRLGTIVSMLMIIVLTGLSIFTRQFALISTMAVIFGAPFCVKNIVIYHFSKRKLHLFFAIGMVIVFVGNSIFLVLTILRGL